MFAAKLTVPSVMAKWLPWNASPARSVSGWGGVWIVIGSIRPVSTAGLVIFKGAGMKRRTFLQISGMTAATALLAGCQSGNEKLIPFLIPPDEGVTPGRADYYASACRFCPAGCGILVRVSEGRAKKIEGNPLHPVNRGRLCARGQAVLQELYHPDRIRQPLKRSGARGTGQFSKITWEEALTLLVGQLKDLQQSKTTDRLAFMT